MTISSNTNNFGHADVIQFNAFLSSDMVILNGKFTVDTTTAEYAAASVLEISLPGLTLEKLTDIPAGDSMQLARAGEEGDYQPQSYAIWIRHYKEYTKITFAHRGGYYEKPSYMDSTSVFY